MKKDTQHIKYGKIIQRSTGTNFGEAIWSIWSIWSIWYHGKIKRFWSSLNSNNSWKRESGRRNDLFSRRSSRNSCVPKTYCRRIEDLTILCTETDKKRNKTIQTSQITLHEWRHSKMKSRVCWVSTWKIWNKSRNDWTCSFSRWKWFSAANSNKQSKWSCSRVKRKMFPIKIFLISLIHNLLK